MAKNSKRLNLDKLRRNAIEVNANELEELNRNQVRLGKKSDGKDQAVYSSGGYADYKSKLSSYLAPSPIADLYDSGSFLNQLFLKVEGQNVLFSSRDGKTESLVKRYKPIFGLTPISMTIAIPLVSNKYVKEVYNELNA